MATTTLEKPSQTSLIDAMPLRADALRVREHHDFTTLAPLRDEWNRLASLTRGNSHFLGYDWLETYWRHNAGEQRLRVLTIEEDCEVSANDKNKTAVPSVMEEWLPTPRSTTVQPSKLIGILPLVVRPEHTKLGMVRTLTYPLHGWGTLYGPIGPDPMTTLRLGMQHLAATPRDYDLFELRWVDEREGMGESTHAELTRHGFAAERGTWFQAYHVDLSAGWDAYWVERTSHWRTNVRANEKKLAKHGRIEFIRHRAAISGDPRWDLYDECVGVAAKSWQGARTDGTTLSHDEVARYLRDAHVSATNVGAADMNLLRVDGRTVAFAYNYAVPGYVYGMRSGFDPEFRSCGVGSVLMRAMLADSAVRGDGILDLGPDHAPAKLPWANRTVNCLKFSYYPKTSWKAWGLKLKRRLTKQAER